MAIRKYQAFISSTFRDLHEARERVTWEVLKIGFIPVGMENFSAMDERGWTTIARAIDQSDYYVVVIAGLYGSIDASTGKSWTQREYEYAKEQGVPKLAFIRDQAHVPGNMVEQGEAVAKLATFKETLGNAHHVETWTTIDDLRAKVPVALMKLAREQESEGNERPGWHRGSVAPSLEEMARLSVENRELRERLAATAPKTLRLLGRLREGASVEYRRILAGGGATTTNQVFRRVVEDDNALVLGASGNEFRVSLDDVKSVALDGDGKATIVVGPF